MKNTIEIYFILSIIVIDYKLFFRILDYFYSRKRTSILYKKVENERRTQP